MTTSVLVSILVLSRLFRGGSLFSAVHGQYDNLCCSLTLSMQGPDEAGIAFITRVDGAIGARGDGIGNSLLEALYACMTFIYGSSWKGEMTSEAKRSLDRSSEESEEVFPGEAGK
ncbi:hypothetical protein Tco_0051357 [Tanacetum coccineum]